MHANISDAVDVGRAVAREVKERDVTFLAASLAYYAFVSLIPLLVVAVVVAAAVGGDALRRQVVELARRYLVQSASAEIERIVADTTGGGGVGLVGAGVALWGALKLFRGLDTAFSRVYGTDAGGLLGQVRDGVVALGAVGVGVVGVSALTAAIGLLPIPFLQWLSPVFLLATLTAAFFPLFYIMPDVPMEPREALPGAVVAAVGWTALGSAFGVYASVTATGSPLYGLLGALLLLVTWFYFGGLVLLVGAVFNAVLAGRTAPPTRPTPSGGVGRGGGVGAGLGAAAGGRTGDRGRSDGAEGDRQLQQGRVSGTERMSTDEPDSATDDVASATNDVADERGEAEPAGAPDIAALDARVDELRADLDEFETDVDERTVDRSELEAELKRYVRGRVRRGHARGWGPYLVLLYGTAMTLGAFYLLEEAWAAVLAMIVVFLSTLGLYVLFVMVGVGLNAAGTPGTLVRKVRDIRQ